MRGLLAGLAVFLVFFTATAGLAGSIGHVILDPSRAGAVAAQLLEDGDLAPRILARLVPGYTSLEQPVRSAVRRAATDDRTVEAARRVTFDDRTGEVDLQPLRDEMVAALRASGQGRLAGVVADDERGSVVTVPMSDLKRYRDARELTRQTALVGGVASVVLAAIALLSSRARLRTLRSLGIAVVLSSALVGALYWLLPGAAQAAGSSDAAQVATALLDLSRARVLTIVLSAAGLGVVLVVAGLVAGRLSRR